MAVPIQNPTKCEVCCVIRFCFLNAQNVRAVEHLKENNACVYGDNAINESSVKKWSI